MKPYHCLIAKNKLGIAIVRPMDDGISDHEWNMGVRMMASKAISRTILEQEARDKGFKVVDALEWKEEFKQELREFYRMTSLPWDKWDKQSPIY